MGPADLQTLLQEFLDACVDALDTIPTFEPGLGGAPARSFIMFGQPQAECCPDGQLTVYSPGVNSDPLEPVRNNWARLNMVSLQANIYRCVPAFGEGGGALDPEEAEAVSEQILADGWALWNHIFNLIQAGQLFTMCSKIIWEGLRSIAPSGGCGGWVLNLRVEYAGYPEAIGT